MATAPHQREKIKPSSTFVQAVSISIADIGSYVQYENRKFESYEFQLPDLGIQQVCPLKTQSSIVQYTQFIARSGKLSSGCLMIS